MVGSVWMAEKRFAPITFQRGDNMTYTKANMTKLQEIIRDGKAIVESLEASKRELQARARERAAKIRRFAQEGKS